MKMKPKSNRRARSASSNVSVKGDIARAMFARWEKDHVDPKPLPWAELKAKFESTRLRQDPLFSK